MNTVVFQVVRICAVLALVCIAAALATPKGRLPLALRGLAKVLEDGRAGSMPPPERRFHRNRPTRAFAFLLVVLAIVLALI